MKKLLVLVLGLSLLSCEIKNTEKEDDPKQDSSLVINRPYYTINVETVDSCEYLILNGTYGRSIIHKENCKNHKIIIKE